MSRIPPAFQRSEHPYGKQNRARKRVFDDNNTLSVPQGNGGNQKGVSTMYDAVNSASKTNHPFPPPPLPPPKTLVPSIVFSTPPEDSPNLVASPPAPRRAISF